ncbi:GcrA family cell cycle regulator [Bradyrhizobium sp. CCGB01]|uniref:GcrA family cell cycle regulator n=1 Tax=Bradyrhizobium sp. CCGB01 TaxID=2949634 RepID=UPI0020B424B8|nr:GcrA family cell cycle regulator [Bradyrhizobium sp. CCGB01]MCP3410064.1 GcrA family cell cycle regulator [Bradyrhizobium sp. CCGB01]
MEPGHWPSEHSDALRDYFLKGISYAEIGRQINARFGTAYTRSAVVGRAKRLGLIAPARMRSPSIVPSLPGEAWMPSPRRSTLPYLNVPPKSAMKPVARVKLRCVGVQPRLITLVELGRDDCRYPYGGDREGEEIAFCGHPRQPGSSYCAPHARLTRRSGSGSARAAGPVVLRLVSAA